MTETQIQLVQSSWEKCIPIADTAASLFYSKLFELDPSLKPLFKSDIKEQGKKLMTMITTAVRGLSNLEAIVGAVQDMGRRHAGYGVKEEHYETVGSALIWTLKKGLGDDFDEATEEAWVATYTLLASTMKDAAAEAA
ncbi:globin family protein [Pelagicoccus mobilis]|uniref:Hemin receptor n=1 Tax=Pelagicoccus mobilis TaxID=415221 RepID=A0A934RYC3_9BACT|nr:globin family protein [Pelagicoccus mobilis]MBK1879985.1 hemin receptor [Pelagicoccus mobilis]